jgi:hypothetical protein
MEKATKDVLTVLPTQSIVVLTHSANVMQDIHQLLVVVRLLAQHVMAANTRLK